MFKPIAHSYHRRSYLQTFLHSLLLASFSSAKDENNSDPDKAAYEQSDEKDATSMFTITAPEDFRLLAEHLYLNPSDFLDRGGTSRDYAEVTFKKENNTFTYLLK